MTHTSLTPTKDLSPRAVLQRALFKEGPTTLTFKTPLDAKRYHNKLTAFRTREGKVLTAQAQDNPYAELTLTHKHGDLTITIHPPITFTEEVQDV